MFPQIGSPYSPGASMYELLFLDAGLGLWRSSGRDQCRLFLGRGEQQLRVDWAAAPGLTRRDRMGRGAICAGGGVTRAVGGKVGVVDMFSM